MIQKVYLSINDDKNPAVFRWDEQEEDFIFEQIPSNLTRCELIEFTEEVKRVTGLQ